MLAPDILMLLDMALREDLAYGDCTSENLFQPSDMARAHVVSRQETVVSGLAVAQALFHQVDSQLVFTPCVQDGQFVAPKTRLATVQGSVVSLLKAERVALNILQHLCGVATTTYQLVQAVSGTTSHITHTRKTLPGLRALQIQAVLDGGGTPHRKSLSHAAMIKDNHVAAAGGIDAAVATLRAKVGHTVRIEVECDTLAQVDEALTAGADVILLDNMSPEILKQAIQRIGTQAITEASGGVTLQTVRALAETGVQYISTSQMTLSAQAIDIGLDFESERPY